jgi:hypothetical protein
LLEKAKIFTRQVTSEQHALPITDKMRLSLLAEGLPLFQQSKGAVSFLQDGRAIIHAFENADVSTAIHELAHIFRRDLSEEDQKVVLEWAGEETWTEAAEEKFARGFERYLAEGKAPNERLREIFEKFRQWLIAIYKQITGSSIDVRITPEMKDVYDRLLGIDVNELQEKVDLQAEVKTLQDKAANLQAEAEQEFAEQAAREGRNVRTGMSRDERNRPLREKAERGELADDLFATPEATGQASLFDEAPKAKTTGKSRRSTGKAMGRTIEADTPLRYRVNADFKDSDLNNTIYLNQIAKQLAEDLDFEIGKSLRTGLIRRFKRKAKGLFFPDSGIVRINSMEDITTLAHEFGHYLDRHIFDIEESIRYEKNDPAEVVVTMATGIKDPKARANRIAALRQKYGNAVVDGILHRKKLRDELKNFDDKNTAEGIAEFVTAYIVDPQRARSDAPSFYAIFENLLDQKPTIRDGLLKAREQFEKFSTQDPRQIIHATINRDSKESRLVGALKKFKENWYYDFIDGFDYLRQLHRQLIDKNIRGFRTDSSPLYQALSMLGVHGKVEQAVLNRPFLRTEKDVRFLDDVKPLIGTAKKPGILFNILQTGRLEAFEDYLVALRNIELFEREEKAKERTKELFQEAKQIVDDLKTLPPGDPLYEDQVKKLKEIRNEIRQLRIERRISNAATASREVSEVAVREFEAQHPDFKTAQEELVKFTDWSLQYYADSGKLSKEQLERIKELNRFYVPFKRYFAEWEQKGSPPTLKTLLKDDSPQVVKRIKGSQRQVVSPIGSILKNTYDLLLAADQNYTLGALVEALNIIDPQIVQEIPPTVVKPVVVLDKEGDFTVRYQLKREKPLRGHIVSVYEDGKAHYYDIPKEYYDAIFRAFEPVSKMVQFFAKPASLLRAGAVQFDPTFGIRNVFRDQPSALNYSQHGYFFHDFFKGLLSRWKVDEHYERFLASGAHQNFLTIVNEQISNESKPLFKLLLSRKERYLKNPFKLLSDFNGATESATRVGAFRNAYRKTRDIYIAMQEARDVGADYSIKGNRMRNLIMLIPFLNARIQHARTLVSAMKHRNKTQLAKIAAIDAAFMTIPAILLYLWNTQDDEREKRLRELPAWRRYGMWNLYIPEMDIFISIPKGPVGILFGSTPEAFLEWLKYNNPKEFKHLFTQFLKDFFPFESPYDFVPQAAKPIFEHLVNRNFFTEREVVPEALQYLPPEQQYFYSTPEVVKLIGNQIGISPLLIEHYLNGYTAGTGRNITFVLDRILDATGVIDGSEDGQVWYKAPIIRGAVTASPIGKRARSVQEFYDIYNHMQRVNRGVNSFADSGDIAGLETYLAKGENRKLFDYYEQNKSTINMLNALLRAFRDISDDIRKSKQLTATEKKEQLRAIEEKMSDIASEFHISYRNNTPFFPTELKALDNLRKSVQRKRRNQKKLNRELVK